MATLCLNMIVKNESHIIEETLENICQHFALDYWVISDTGSTDNTIQIIEDFFRDKQIPGEIHQAEWRDFAYNRNLALDACAGKADYVLFFDADDLVQGDLKLPELSHDAYHLQMKNEQGIINYFRALIVRNNQTYKWKGVLHEVVVSSAEQEQDAIVEGNYCILSRRLGNRNLNPQKALNDAQLLQAAFESGAEPEMQSRYAFYCAQSYHAYSFQDKKYQQNALEWYQKRTEFPHDVDGVDDEKYLGYLYSGQIYEDAENLKEAFYNWQCGIELDPMRAECWYQIARRHHWNHNYWLAYNFARQAAELKRPGDVRIFIVDNIYTYWSQYELCVAAWKVGKLEESYQAFKQMLRYLPVENADRVFLALETVIPQYEPWIMADPHAEVRKLKQDLIRLGREVLWAQFA